VSKYLCCALLLCLTAAPLFADDAEDRAAKAVEKLGGQVVRDDKDPAKPVVAVTMPQYGKVTYADLKGLEALKGLKSLDLSSCEGLTGAAPGALAMLKGLQTLNLDGTDVTDAGLKELAPLTGLKHVALYDCKDVTDAGVAGLKEALPDCEIAR
jgi:hypothetical protein